MADESVRDLIKKRGVIKGKVTLFIKYVSTLKNRVDNGEEISPTKVIELQERIFKN